MLSKLRQQIRQWRGLLITAPTIAGLVIAASYTVGLFQFLEFAALDQFFRLRMRLGREAKDSRIVIVSVDEKDIKNVGQWPMSDSTLTQLIQNLKVHQPRAIGLDLYRNLPVEPGHQEWVQIMKTTPNLIGVEKAEGNSVEPPPELPSEQISLADLIPDEDGKVRRGLLSTLSSGTLRFSLGTQLALMYLAEEGIELQELDDLQYQLGKAQFSRFQRNDGGYVNADDGGYQILLNLRGGTQFFERISLTKVLNNHFSSDFIHDRIVLIGVVGESGNDFFYTSYGRLPGVSIHANIASQIISAALEGRTLIRVWPDSGEWLWILFWSFFGGGSLWQLLQMDLFKRSTLQKWMVFGCSMIFVGGSVVVSSYITFVLGWWIPVFSPLVAMLASAMVVTINYSQKLQLLATLDGLTQIPNRRYFNESLNRQWGISLTARHYISIILCDVDHFKLYNDTYGHQAGDYCLQQVAQALSSAARRTDIVARYGGEEFVILLPHTDQDEALAIAQVMIDHIHALNMPHSQSSISDYVTLSCGIASMVANDYSFPSDLVEKADEALYKAKENGRDRAMVYTMPGDWGLDKL